MLIQEKFSAALPSDLWAHGPVIVGVSGGPDSIALVHLLLNQKKLEAKPQRNTEQKNSRPEPSPAPSVAGQRTESTSREILLAHFDHRWRTESAEDVSWVQRMSDGLGLRLEVGRAENSADELKSTNKLGLEGLARQQRYDFFDQVIRSYSARYLLVAHHQADQIETVLMRLMRGTSIDGLSGIPKARPMSGRGELLRAMLKISRDEIMQFLKEHQLGYLSDPSNRDESRTRNRVRHQLIPFLREQFGETVVQSIERLAESAKENSSAWQPILNQHQDALKELAVGRLIIDVKLLPPNRGLVKRLVRCWWSKAKLPQQEMSHSHWERLVGLMIPPKRMSCGKVDPVWTSNGDFPGKVTASRSKGFLTIEIYRSKNEKTY